MNVFKLVGGVTGSELVDCQEKLFVKPELALASLGLSFSQREHTMKVTNGGIDSEILMYVALDCVDGGSYSYCVIELPVHEAPEHL